MAQPELPVRINYQNVRKDFDHNLAMARAHLEELKASGEYASFLAKLAVLIDTSKLPPKQVWTEMNEEHVDALVSDLCMTVLTRITGRLATHELLEEMP